MEFRILGPLEVREDDRLLACASAKQRLLLAVLLMHANEVVSSDRLIEALWGENPPETAVKALQMHVSQLRKLLEPERTPGGTGQILVTRPPGYELRVDPQQLDLNRFEQAMREARSAAASGRTEEAARGMRDALALWRGPPLADLTFEDSLRPDTARLEELHLVALEDRLDADLALGRHADLVGELEALVAEHPLRERLRAQLMLALYRSRRQAEALEVYRSTRHVLVEELGIEPGRELQQLEQAILLQDPSLDWAPPGAETSETSKGNFVGREGELQELRSGLDAAIAGRGRLFLLVGEPGIGKSRLADELISEARARRARVIVGRCWEAGGAPAYWPWVQSMRMYVEQSEPEELRSQLADGAADIATILPQLRELFPDLPARPLETQGARFRLFDSAARFLRSAASSRPLVIVLDDLHAADEPSLLLLRFLAGELDGSRMLVLGTYRDVDPTVRDPLRSTLAELAREQVTRRIHLGGLEVADVRRYIELDAGATPPAELIAAIHAETEGNPLFVGEMVRLLAAEGRLVEADARLGLAIPQGVREVIGRRLGRLSAECGDLLVLASALGRDFGLDALGQLSELPADDLLEILDEAVAARVLTVVPGTPSRLRFAHALIRETLYDQLTAPRRMQLHKRAGEALEALYAADPDPHLAELSHHFFAAASGGDPDKALEYAWRAGDRALHLLAHEEAARLYERAIEALGLTRVSDERASCELLLALGAAQARGGDLGSAKETFLQASEIARRLDDPEQLARAALGYGGAYVWFRAGKDERLIPLLEDALAAQSAGDSAHRVRLLARLAGALRDRPVPERRASLSQEAVEMARRIGDPAILAYALEGSYSALSWPRDTDAWLSMGRELTQIAGETGDKELAFFGRTHAFGASMLHGDIRAADRERAGMAALAEELHRPVHRWTLLIMRGMRALFAGRMVEADQLMRQLTEPGSGGQGLDVATFAYVVNLQTWAVRRAQGRLAEIEPALEILVEEYPDWFIFRCILASVHSELGRHAQAPDELARLSADDFADLHAGADWFVGASLLAGVCASLEDTTRAPHLYEALLPYADYNVYAHPEVSLGAASRHLGVLASAMCRWDEATGHFEHALAMNARMEARPWVAHTQLDYARMLLARNDRGDRQKADLLVSQAGMTYEALGMQSYAADASALKPGRTA